jgi:hypothetical protein
MAAHPLRTFFALIGALGSVAVFAGAGCETYDSPPRPAIDGLVDGTLSDPSASLFIRFSEPIDTETLGLRIVKLETDLEGNLLDEDADVDTDLTTFFTYIPKLANIDGGTAELLDNDTLLRIDLNVPLPAGPSLVVVLEKGLADLEGNAQEERLRLGFSYSLSCDESTGTDAFPSGTYFIVANVVKPIQTQIQLWGRIEVDPATGRFIGQFTNADRNPDPNRCTPACTSTQACRTLPSPECVVPSTEAGDENEYPDYVPNPTPPTGYSFAVTGCVLEGGDAIAFVNDPADVVIQQPDVTVQGIQLTASFVAGEDTFLHATGSVTAETVFIGGSPSGGAVGTMIARFVPDDETPPGVPDP